MKLNAALAERLARVALGHVTREFPQKLDQVLEGVGDLKRPRDLHPVFHGSFDWHSCVHAHWMLARLRRRFPEAGFAAEVAARFDAAFTAEAVEAERAYLSRPSARGFERPYGWAWLLKLHLELDAPWADALAPLAQAFAERFRAHLPLATYPVRHGVHSNTAFALILAAEWAEQFDAQLLSLVRETAWRWYGTDADAQAWEPSGEDFLSPVLCEALLMARLLPMTDFRTWCARFMPEVASGEPQAIFTPAVVSDRTDGRIVHLDGLNLSRAWCFRGIAACVEQDVRRVMLEAAERHVAASLPHVDGHYMGAHWLATFAVLAVDA